tara:strand:- start:628 stop:843 length:216 start_codon:yes stop_codon:yes gene_type:complete
MTHINKSNQNRISAIFGTHKDISFCSNFFTSKGGNDLDHFSKSKEILRREIVGLLEDRFVKEAFITKGISF